MYTVSGVVCCSARFLGSPFGLCLYRLCPCPMLLRSYRRDRYSRVLPHRSLYLAAEDLPPDVMSRSAATGTASASASASSNLVVVQDGIGSGSGSLSSWWRFWRWGRGSPRHRTIRTFLQNAATFRSTQLASESGAERLFEMYNERVLSQVGTDNVLLRVFPSMPAGSEISNPPVGSSRHARASTTFVDASQSTPSASSASEPPGTGSSATANYNSDGSAQAESASMAERNEFQVGPPDSQPDHLVLLMPLTASVAGARRQPHHRSRSSHRSLASRLLRPRHRRQHASATPTGSDAAGGPARPVEIQGLLFPRPPPPYTPAQSDSAAAFARPLFGLGPVTLNDLSNPPPAATDTQSSFSVDASFSTEQVYDYLNNLSTSSLRERDRERRSRGAGPLQPGFRYRPADSASAVALAQDGRRAPSPQAAARPPSFLFSGHNERRGTSSASRFPSVAQQQLASADSLSQIAPPSYSTIDLTAMPLVAMRARTPSPPPTPPAARANNRRLASESTPRSSFVSAVVLPEDAYPLASLSSYMNRRPPTPLVRPSLISATPEPPIESAAANRSPAARLTIGGASTSSEAESAHVPYRLLLSYAHSARPHSACIDRTAAGSSPAAPAAAVAAIAAAAVTAHSQRLSEEPAARDCERSAGRRPLAPLPDSQSQSSIAVGSAS